MSSHHSQAPWTLGLLQASPCCPDLHLTRQCDESLLRCPAISQYIPEGGHVQYGSAGVNPAGDQKREPDYFAKIVCNRSLDRVGLAFHIQQPSSAESTPWAASQPVSIAAEQIGMPRVHGPYRIRQGVEHGAVVKDELCEGGQAVQGRAPGRAVGADVTQPGAVPERQALQGAHAAHPCTQEGPV